MKIRFVSKNIYKFKEVESILKDIGVEVIQVKYAIDEIQTEDVDLLVKDKLLKAFRLVGRSVFVEHTGLYIESLNQFPGGLTQIFWDKLSADKFSSLLGVGENTNVTAKTVIGYCDSMKMHLFKGEILGKIASPPRGSRDFQWDCIFYSKRREEDVCRNGKEEK